MQRFTVIICHGDDTIADDLNQGDNAAAHDVNDLT